MAMHTCTKRGIKMNDQKSNFKADDRFRVIKEVLFIGKK